MHTAHFPSAAFYYKSFSINPPGLCLLVKLAHMRPVILTGAVCKGIQDLIVTTFILSHLNLDLGKAKYPWLRLDKAGA